MLAPRLLCGLAGGPLPELGRVCAQLEVLPLAPEQLLFRAGARGRHVYFVRSGIVRLAYDTANGAARVKEFVAEGRFFASAQALVGDGRTSYRAQALTAAVVERVGYGLLEAMATVHPAWQSVLTRGFQLYGLRKEQRERELLTLDASQRYRALLDGEPALAARLPQHEIAAYLGITAVALSRIRARLRRVGDNGHPSRSGAPHDRA